jgi:hypothetical protein
MFSHLSSNTNYIGFGIFLNLSVLGNENFCLEVELLRECREASSSAISYNDRGIEINKII